MAEADRNSLDGDDTFQPDLPLVEDYNRDYVYQLTEEDIVNDAIEQMYGPFDSWYVDSGSSTPTRRLIAPAKSEHDRKLEEIEKLKQDIRDKEMQHRQAQEKRLALEKELVVDREIVLQEARKEEEEEQEKQQQELKAHIEEKLQNTLKALESIKDSATHSNSDRNGTRLLGAPKNSKSQITTTDFEQQGGEDNASMDMSISSVESSNDGTSDNDYYATADENEEDEVEKLLDQELEELNNQLRKIREEEKQIQVKLLAMKVRMSIEINRKEVANKAIASKDTKPDPETKRTKPQKTPTKASKKKRISDEAQNSGTSSSQAQNSGASSSQALPNFGYQLPVYFNAMQPRPQYYPPAPLMLNQPYLQHPMPQLVSPPPPPPPTDLPPPIPPPPPPPPPPSSSTSSSQTIPTVRLRQSHKPKLATPYADITHNDTHRVKEYEATLATFREFEQLISVRIFHSNQESYPPASLVRLPPRPRRLITVEQYTLPINMFLLNKEYEAEQQAQYRHQSFILPAGQPVEVELTDLTSESPLFIMLHRKAQGKKFDEKMAGAINAAILCIPSEIDLSTFHVRHAYGLPLHPEKLSAMYQLVKAFCEDYKEKEFLGALKLELSMFVNGPTSLAFQQDFEATKKQFPLSVDAHWQGILSETTFVSQLARIKAFLNDIYKSHGVFDSPESVTASAMTAEVLTRLVRLNGLSEVLKMLTGNEKFEISLSEYAPFPLTETPGLYLLHNDKYYLWMLVLYYFVIKSLPQGVCETWMNTLVKEGNPQMNKPLFAIDWSETLTNNPLDKATAFGATNILLSMWKHFSQLACSDSRKKPLLIGVLRTLVSFLMHTAQYKVPGTLLLVNKLAKVLLVTPEVRELEVELEFKRNEDPKKLIHQLFSITSSRPQSFALAYRCICLYGERAPYTVGFYAYVACILAFPLVNVKSDSESLLGFINQHDMEHVQDEYRHRLVQSLIDQYKVLVGMISSSSPNAKSQEKAAFAWINLLLLTKILGVINTEKQTEVRQEMDTIFHKGFSLINEYDGKLLFSKYASTLTADNQK